MERAHCPRLYPAPRAAVSGNYRGSGAALSALDHAVTLSRPPCFEAYSATSARCTSASGASASAGVQRAAPRLSVTDKGRASCSTCTARRRYRRPQPLGDAHEVVEVVRRVDDGHELLAAVAKHLAVGAERVAQRVGHLDEHLVAHEVPVTVVDVP